MIKKLRIFVAFGLVAAGTLVLAPLQLLSMKTRLWPETVVLKIWHSMILKALGMRVHVKGALS
ncbi:MAG: 1-acyl-sn-glycerol-3-phosphate acyltransferase, partial [Mesorhizobium sp.]